MTVAPISPQPLSVDDAAAILGNKTGLTVIRHLMDHGPSTITSIIQVVGRSHTLIWRCLKDLEHAGIVSANVPEGARHRRALVYEYVPEGFIAALDLLKDAFQP
ncbi:winged helix-turn-helix domain-containing protein [Paenarthrobacter sp. NPDC056912]|uniref:winged helix-turn-helix domain-containing protein n=1 Tax=Paenarthrobacter sp. NPDC056912 TaxID=3345965 RepID=UPI00366C5EAE